MNLALLVVDMQNDFLPPSGSLAVAEGDQIMGLANRLIHEFEDRKLPIFITRDWHPANHCSFKEQGGPWPPHCVQGTPGAEFHKDLYMPKVLTVISKANRPELEAFSDFEGTGLAERLNAFNTDTLVVMGLATDYCVRATVLDGLAEGFKVIVVNEGIRAVNVNPGDGEKAILEMRHLGARFESLEDVLKKLPVLAKNI